MISFRRGPAGQPNAAGDTLRTVLASVWAQGAILVSGVLVARILGVEDRGHLALFSVLSVIVSQLGSLGLPLGATFWIAKQPASVRPIVRSLAWPGLVQVATLTLVQAAVLYLVVQGESHEVRVGAAYTLALPAATLTRQYALAFLQGQRRFKAYNVVLVFPAMLYAGGVAALFVSGGGDLPTVTLVWVCLQLLASVVSLAYAVIVLPPTPDDAPSPPSRSEMLNFGARGMLGSVSPLDTFQLDQAVVGLFISPSALGLYVVAVAFTNLPRLVAVSIGAVAYPHVASRSDEATARRSMWRFVGLAVLTCGIIVVALEATAGRLVTLFFGDEFADAGPLVRVLLISALFAGLRRVLADGARGAGYPGLGTIAELVGWLCLLIVLPIAVSRLGVDGVPIALVISSGVALAVLVISLLIGDGPGRGRVPPAYPPLVEEMPR